MAILDKRITRAFTGDGGSLGSDTTTQVVRYDAFGFANTQELLADFECPKYNDPLPEQPSLLANQIRPDRQGTGFWHIYVTYAIPADGNKHPGKNGAGDNGDPTLLPTEWDWEDSLETEPVDRDYKGQPITNSARDPLSTPATNTFSFLVLIAYKWYRGFPLNLSNQFRNKTNSDSWRPAGNIFGGRSFDKGIVKCTSIKPVGRLTASARFVQVAHSFMVRPDGWKFRHMDVGRRMYSVTGPNLVTVQPIVLKSPPKAPITDDVRLDGKGRPLDLKTYEPLFGRTDDQNNDFTGPEIEMLKDGVFLKWTMLGEERYGELNL